MFFYLKGLKLQSFFIQLSKNLVRNNENKINIYTSILYHIYIYIYMINDKDLIFLFFYFLLLKTSLDVDTTSSCSLAGPLVAITPLVNKVLPLLKSKS